MKVKITYLDFQNQQRVKRIVELPVAIGRDITKLPKKMDDRNIFHLPIFNIGLGDRRILIKDRQEEIVAIDLNNDRELNIENNCLTFNGIKLKVSPLDKATKNNNINSNNKCQRMVGFLVKRPCNRTSRLDCPYCNNGENEETDIYESDYTYYEDYGSYNTWGFDYYCDRDSYHYDAENQSVEFNPIEEDTNFESDFSDS